MSAEQRHRGPSTTGPGGPEASARAESPAGAEPAGTTVSEGAGDVVGEVGGRDGGEAGGEAVAGTSPAGASIELEAVRRQRDEYLDMLRRVQADFENYKKRMVRQQTDLLERAAESMVVRLLPVLDAFELARVHLEAEESAEARALLAAAGLLSDTLAKEGLERFAGEGEDFDPATHEAVDHEPAAADEASSGGQPSPGQETVAQRGPVVTAVLRPGYRYKGRVVRPAMVKVRG